MKKKIKVYTNMYTCVYVQVFVSTYKGVSFREYNKCIACKREVDAKVLKMLFTTVFCADGTSHKM